MTRKTDFTPFWNAQRRAALYHILLLKIVDSYYSSSDGTHSDSPVYCELCGNWIDVRLYSDTIKRNIDHGPLCPVKLAEAALVAAQFGDNEAIRKMLEEIGGAQIIASAQIE